MNTLITPLEAHRHAFGSGEILPPDAVTESDIMAAEERYLRPLIGAALHNRLLEGGYEEFRRNYLTTCLALFTRVVVQARLDTRTTSLGTLSPKTEHGTATDLCSRRRLRQSLRNEAHTLLRRALRYLDEHREAFPEYDNTTNLFNRCSIDGGFVQIH